MVSAVMIAVMTTVMAVNVVLFVGMARTDQTMAVRAKVLLDVHARYTERNAGARPEANKAQDKAD